VWSGTNRGVTLVLKGCIDGSTSLTDFVHIGHNSGGKRVIFIANCDTAPTSNPVGGGIIFSDSGALKWRGSSGTVTTMANADPHCKRCGSDFCLEWERPDDKQYFMVCVKCMAEFIGLMNNKVKPDWIVTDKKLQYVN
jgi:hypothetical protein